MKNECAITLVIPVRNEVETLDHLWQTILAQTTQPGTIIFVDGGSTDHTIEQLRSLAGIDQRVKIIESGGAMPGEGRNIGIEAAKTDWVALTDAGTLIDSHWLERLYDEVLAQPSLDVVYGNYEPIIGGFFDQCAALAYVPVKSVRRSARDLTPMRGPSTASMLLRRSVWKEVGGFPSWRAAEDLIFFERIERKGCLVGWAPLATVRWQLRPGLLATFRKFSLYSKHNVWAGMARYWHYGVARQYLIGIVLLLPALFDFSPWGSARWWSLLPVAGFLARAVRSISLRRVAHGRSWVLNPMRIGLVALILLVIDFATFNGWLKALTTKRPEAAPPINQASPANPANPVNLKGAEWGGELMRSLYLCYFGLREPLVQTQVLPYLRELARGGNEMLLLTFEPAMPEPDQVACWREKLAADGIEWRALKYHKRPSLPATIWDILVGLLTICRINASRRIDILHARSHVPLAMAMLARPLTGASVIFDLRGLIADEYVDAGVWRRGSIVYRVMKWLEMAGFRRADWLVVLTNSMRQWILERRLRPLDRISVIPCCIDRERFRSEEPPPATPASTVESDFELVYAGSVTGLYLLDEMAAFFLTLAHRQPGARLRILTASSPEAAAARLRQAGLADRQFTIGSATPAEIPEYLRRAKVGLSFRLPTFSQIAASPTKIPEYLAAGIPVISNSGIGDTDMIIEGSRTGVIVRDLSDSGYREAVEQLLTLMADPTLAARCRETAKRNFDLHTVGGPRYRNAYSSLRPKRQKYKIEI